MSWVNDLASVAGMPAGAATLAVAMYAACAAAEKAARPEALQDIGRILKDPSWSRSVRPSAIVARVFVWTFGERQFGQKCIKRSPIVSFLMLVIFSLIFVHEGGHVTGKGTPLLAAIAGIVTLFVPDYVALGKTRMLLSQYDAGVEAVGVLVILLIDFLASAAISLFSLCVFQILVFHELPSWQLLRLTYEGLRFLIGLGRQPDPMPMYVMFLISTLFTSVWTVLILSSTAVLKLLAPVQRFTSWFFDVENHPVKAIGIVSGALVMAGSLVWTILIHLL